MDRAKPLQELEAVNQRRVIAWGGTTGHGGAAGAALCACKTLSETHPA